MTPVEVFIFELYLVLGCLVGFCVAFLLSGITTEIAGSHLIAAAIGGFGSVLSKNFSSSLWASWAVKDRLLGASDFTTLLLYFMYAHPRTSAIATSAILGGLYYTLASFRHSAKRSNTS